MTGTTYRELAALFLRLGLTAFGGPAAHVAMMRHEVVDRRRWLTDAEFLDLFAATNLIPGPNSTEMAIHLGYRRGGPAGLVVAGTCFIAPAALLVAGLAALYVRLGETPAFDWLMYGVGPVVMAIVVDAMVKLGRTTLTHAFPVILFVAVVVLTLRGADALALLAGGAAVGLASTFGPRSAAAVVTGLLSGTTALAALATGAAEAVPLTLTRLGLFFLKVGSVLFGSGYVLLAFLRADLTERWGWLTDQQLIDAITVGQVTPGPVFTTATFIGYLLGGWPGAVVATVAIFAPGFVFVAASHRWIPRLRGSRRLSGLLDGVVVTSLGLIAGVAWQLGRTVVVDAATATIGIVAVGLLWTWKPNATWLILAGAVIGWISFLWS